MPFHDSRLYDASDTNVYKTDGYSGSHTDVNSTERYTDNIDLTVQAGAQVDFLFDGDNGTDDLIITIYKRRDSSWTGNEIAWKPVLTISNDGSEDQYHYTISEEFQPGHYRFGLKSSSTNTTFEMQVDYRGWRLTRSIS